MLLRYRRTPTVQTANFAFGSLLQGGGLGVIIRRSMDLQGGGARQAKGGWSEAVPEPVVNQSAQISEGSY
jgi:hypothetical protein